jgi:hypothetical protein
LTAGNGVIAPARQSRVLAIKVVTIKNGDSAIMVLHPSNNTEAQSTYNRSNRTTQSLIPYQYYTPVNAIFPFCKIELLFHTQSCHQNNTNKQRSWRYLQS